MNPKNGADDADDAFTSPPSPPRFLTARQFAESTGIATRTVQRYLERGLVPGAVRFGPGTKWRIPEGASLPESALGCAPQSFVHPVEAVIVSTERVENRYRRGELSFEDAVRGVAGVNIAPAFFAQFLRKLAARDPAEPVSIEHEAALLDRDVRMQVLIQRSLTPTDAANRLGVSTERVYQRLAGGTLWGFKISNSWLLPPSQFTATDAVPHVHKVLPLLAKDLHPLTVQTLLTEPHPSLLMQGQPVSIVTWLTVGEGGVRDIEQAAAAITAFWSTATN